MPLDAPVTIPTVSRYSVRPAIVPALRDGAEREPHELGNEPRAQETRVVRGEPARVLVEADRRQARQGDLAHRLGHLHREVVALVRAAELERGLQAAERLQRDAAGAAGEEPRLQREGQLLAAVGDPVAEEEEVARLRLHHAVEAVDERAR